ncbi:bifunctional 2',3'-cyclic-nucleotide 2'-phosphodiesterase/3'-nucleotidase [Streptococcus sp. NLN64]|uniref:bifunctional 2',3'-cyclic-nucleotide 2'-phosphodiesterase/3'-nucleotidase n=1 Tax=Streptococcus sp. NLN64 TaxID=2822799 RepID=UPI0018CB3BBD|nr:bifunctional 2',3'-cyclic-nucleotide 2'-phosphodiesterase/3'-nucleotidase [Streptococcus sp. NLN64]MBG9366708.1 bifunctional 2',3'-cyclic-nucleotide 2'-phosphodiesterase/3'-nucleotidase [Streptococcus sp. NLN64]
MVHSYLKKSAMLLSLAAAVAVAEEVQADQATNPQPAAGQETASPALPQAETPVSPDPLLQAPAEAAQGQDNGGLTIEEKAPEATVLSNTVQEEPVKPPVEGQRVDMRILATTDLHTNLVNYDYYQDMQVETLGLAKTAVLMEEAIAENSNVVIVDSGDTIQGTPLGTYKAIVDPVKEGEEHPMFAAFKELNYDGAALGNHEFNYGLDYLRRVVASSKVPLLNANVLDAQTKEHLFTPYVIVPKTFKDSEGQLVTVQVGLTGIVPPQIMNWDRGHLEGKVIALDAVQAVTDLVPQMRKAGADVVVVMSHSGIGDDTYLVGEENIGYQLAGIPGVDAVATGHSHANFPSGTGTGFYSKIKGVDDTNGKINGIPVTMAGKYGDHLGIMDLKLHYTNGAWQVEESGSVLRKIDTKSSKADERVLNLAKEVHEATIRYVRQEVGQTPSPIHSYFSLVQDDPSVQIVNQAQLWYAKQVLAGTEEANLPLLSAAAPFKAGARNDPNSYTDIKAGPLAIKNVADLYVYDNVVALLKINGAQLKEWLEMAAGQFNQVDPTKKEPQNMINTSFRTYNFDVIDGVTYELDITQPNKYSIGAELVNPTASRVRNLRYQGKEVTDDQIFMVVTNNYRASGPFPGVKDAQESRLLNLQNRQALIDYIVSEKTIDARPNHNWSFADTIKDLDLRFLTSLKAQEHLASNPAISFVGISETVEGFGEFRYQYRPLAEPEQPVQPEHPTKPEQPSQPTNPASPNQPATSVQPLTPTKPNRSLDSQESQVLANQPSWASKVQESNLLAAQSPSSEATLPNTGTKDSIWMSFGLGLLALLPAGFGKRKQK